MELDNKNWSDTFHTAAQALISLIPGAGGLIGSFYASFLSAVKEERLRTFLVGMDEEIKSNFEKINAEFVKKTDFWDLLDKTTRKVVDERSETKRNAYKNILLKGIFNSGVSYDDTEYQMRLLDQLNDNHIELLRLLKNPQEFSKHITLSYSIGGSYRDIFNQVLPSWNNEYLADHLSDLENLRLIIPITGSLQTMMTTVTIENLQGKLTNRGSVFISFILRE